jgi:cobalamin transport system substrate-binding protein
MRWRWAGVPVYLLGLLAGVCVLGADSLPGTDTAGQRYHRIISMAPSLTETLFALNLGSSVIGVSPYCTYPPEVVDLPKVGGYLDPNYEVLISLNPDLILMLPSNTEHRDHLTKLGLRCEIIQQETVDDIPLSILSIGSLCGVSNAAEILSSRVSEQIRAIEKITAGLPHPVVMVTVGRDFDAGRLDHVFIAGKDSFHGRLVELAGGENAYKGKLIDYPSVSGEGIISMNPDIILEMIPDLERRGLKKNRILSAWQSLPSVPAVRNGQIHIFSADFVSIPGPRVVEILRQIVMTLHPEVNIK